MDKSKTLKKIKFIFSQWFIRTHVYVPHVNTNVVEILKEKSINAGKQNKMGFFWVNYWVWAVEQQKAQPINQTTKSTTYKSKCEPTYITKRKL
jgi:imidazoleglycerol phosphate synthase glutamine amidotransferase subunit HisH